jgi:hypothetical protein
MSSARCLRFLCFLVIAVAGYGQNNPPAREQTVFDENNSIQRPVPLPPGALKALLQRKEIKDNLREIADSDRNNLTQFFSAAEVYLSDGDQTDLVVMGKSPMSGADNTWFWVIRLARKAPFVVLFAGGNSLEVLGTRTNGRRDISSKWSNPNGTQTRIYQFDGVRYRLRKERWHENR